jgi:hypothetical protein
VPAQYDAAVPASLMIFNDGQALKNMEGDIRAPNVLDNLIYRPRDPGDAGGLHQSGPDAGTARADAAGVEDPERRGIGGVSSGAIAAFTVAWERPDEFHKVLSIVGGFTNIRGGDGYADIVRKSGKKPLRVYLQDGRNDNRGVRNGVYDQRRDLCFQNVRLMQALTEKGYDVNCTWGIGQHGSKQGGAIFPDMMRWLWRDHPLSTDVNDAVERAFQEPKPKASLP